MGNSIAIQSIKNKKYVSISKSKSNKLVTCRDTITDTEKFQAFQNKYKPGWYNLISLAPRNNYSVTILYDKTLHAIETNQEFNLFVEFCDSNTMEVYCGACVSGIYGPKFLTVNEENAVCAEADNVTENEKFKIILID